MPVTDLLEGIDDQVTSFWLNPGQGFGTHTHSKVQLVWPHNTLLRVECGLRSWLIDRHTAVWIPAGIQHDTFAVADRCTVRSVYLRAPTQAGSTTWPFGREHIGEARVVPLEPLIDAVVDAIRAEQQTVDEASRRRLEVVLYDRLIQTLRTPAYSPGSEPLLTPNSGPALDVATALLMNPRDGRTLATWGRAFGASERTLTRAWRAQTGMTFQAWRQEVRMRRALEHLEGGASVRDCATRVGYASASAFACAFRERFCVAPRSLG